jgi:hypothetical protein
MLRQVVPERPFSVMVHTTNLASREFLGAAEGFLLEVLAVLVTLPV